MLSPALDILFTAFIRIWILSFIVGLVGAALVHLGKEKRDLSVEAGLSWVNWVAVGYI